MFLRSVINVHSNELMRLQRILIVSFIYSTGFLTKRCILMRDTGRSIKQERQLEPGPALNISYNKLGTFCHYVSLNRNQIKQNNGTICWDGQYHTNSSLNGSGASKAKENLVFLLRLFIVHQLLLVIIHVINICRNLSDY